MLELSAELTKGRGLFFGDRSVAVQAKLTPKDDETNLFEIPVASLTQLFLKFSPEMMSYLSLPRYAPQAGRAVPLEISNVRGRPPAAFGLQSARPKLEQNCEELFWGEGSIVHTDHRSTADERASSSEKDEPFHFRLLSRFDSFQGSQKIVHRVEPQASRSLREVQHWLRPDRLARMLPLHLERVRFGSEFYRPRAITSLLGLTPMITGKFYLEISRKLIVLEASQDHLNTMSGLPHDDRGILKAIDRALQEIGLFAGFYQRLAQLH